jgi:hypothetical protein
LEVPQTVRAKSVVYQLDMQQFTQQLFALLFGEWILRGYRPAVAAYGLLAPVVVVVAIDALGVSKKLKAPWMFEGGLLVAGICILTAYGVRMIGLFPWYLPLFVVPIVFASLSAVQSGGWRRTLVVAGALPLWIQPLGVLVDATTGTPRVLAANLRCGIYARIGADLARQLPPSSVVLAPEIGALGLTYPGPIFDALGLVSPGALAYHPVPYPQQRRNGMVGAIPRGLIPKVQPEAIVTMEDFGQPLHGTNELDNYDVSEYPLPDGGIWNSRNVRVYLRKAAP